MTVSAAIAIGRTRAQPARFNRLDPALWTLAAVALGGLVGAATAAGGARAGILVAVAPVLFAILGRPEWLPRALTASVFAEAFSIGGTHISRLAGPFAFVVLLLQLRSQSPATLKDLDRPLGLCIAA